MFLYGRLPSCKRRCLGGSVELQSYIRPVCAGSSSLLALMEFAERVLFFGASFVLPSRFRLFLSRSNLSSHHTTSRCLTLGPAATSSSLRRYPARLVVAPVCQQGPNCSGNLVGQRDDRYASTGALASSAPARANAPSVSPSLHEHNESPSCEGMSFPAC